MSKKKIDYKELYENLYDKYMDLCIENNQLYTTIKTIIHMYVRQEGLIERLQSKDS